jgi:hypothetical protein
VAADMLKLRTAEAWAAGIVRAGYRRIVRGND